MFGMRPLMTQYEYCLLCAQAHEAKGNLATGYAYRRFMANMTLEEAARLM